MISDLLAAVAGLDRETDGPLDEKTAADAAIEAVPRPVSKQERAELRAVLNDGWLDE